MPFVDTVINEVDESFVRIANSDIEVILKQLTQDEKVALLTGAHGVSGCIDIHKHERGS